MLDVLVATTAHDVADARLHRLVSGMAAAGLDVAVEGIGRREDAPAAALDVRVHAGRPRLVRAWRALRTVATARARVLVVVDPELILLAPLWRALHRAPVVADVHEDYAAVVHDRWWLPSWSRPLGSFAARMVPRAAARADLTVVADHHVPPLDDRMVVRNLPRLDDLPTPAPRDDAPRAVYVGDVRASRGLHTMVDTVVSTEPWTLDLIGAISAGDAAWVRERAARGGRPDAVRVHGRRPPDGSWAIASGAWIGFAVLADTPAFRQAMPTKLYEYAAMGIPPLVSDLEPLRRFVAESGGGVVTDGAEAVTARLRAWRDDPTPLDRLREAGRAWAEAHLTTPSPFDDLGVAVRRLVRPAAGDLR
ncbi:MAG: glycosyltransferase [Actinobacteria bacterium]|nr:glycosyltransferase [Actinomycetota bacterium]